MLKSNLSKKQAHQLAQKYSDKNYEWVNITRERDGSYSLYYSPKMWDDEIEHLSNRGLDVLKSMKRKRNKPTMKELAYARIDLTVRELGRKLRKKESQVIELAKDFAEKVRSTVLLVRFEKKFEEMICEYPELLKAYKRRIQYEKRLLDKAEKEIAGLEDRTSKLIIELSK